MVKALHGAGIEGILDVVSNHTAEGSHEGPMLSFKGIDDATYYRRSPEDRRFYIDAIHQDPVLSCASSSSLSRRGTR